MGQDKVTDPNWGKAEVRITDPAWGQDAKPAPKPSNTLKLRSLSTMLEAPIDTETGKPFRAQIQAPPRGVLPVIAGLASALIPGGGALRGVVSMAAGGLGEAADAKLHGEDVDLGNVAYEAATQGMADVVPKVASGLRLGGQKAVLNAGLSQAQRLNRPNPTMGELGMDIVSSVPYIGKVGMNAAGHMLYKTGQLANKVPQPVRDAITPNMLRNLLLISRLSENKK